MSGQTFELYHYAFHLAPAVTKTQQLHEKGSKQGRHRPIVLTLAPPVDAATRLTASPARFGKRRAPVTAMAMATAVSRGLGWPKWCSL